MSSYIKTNKLNKNEVSNIPDEHGEDNGETGSPEPPDTE